MASRTVVITGGVPYLSDCPYNSSQVIRDALPLSIDRPDASIPTIKLRKFPIDLPCVFAQAREVFPTIWKTDPATYGAPIKPSPEPTACPLASIDLVVHLGMRIREDTICFETNARRHVYDRLDLEGQPQGDGDDERWRGLPETLYPALDVEAAAATVAAKHPDIATRVSRDAGGNFCEYQLYSSLAQLKKAGQVARVVFVHVPKQIDDAALARATAVLETYIAELVDQDVR